MKELDLEYEAEERMHGSAPIGEGYSTGTAMQIVHTFSDINRSPSAVKQTETKQLGSLAKSIQQDADEEQGTLKPIGDARPPLATAPQAMRLSQTNGNNNSFAVVYEAPKIRDLDLSSARVGETREESSNFLPSSRLEFNQENEVTLAVTCSHNCGIICSLSSTRTFD